MSFSGVQAPTKSFAGGKVDAIISLVYSILHIILTKDGRGEHDQGEEKEKEEKGKKKP